MALTRGVKHCDSPHSVGVRLFASRINAGLSQRQLAAKTTVTAAYISRLEAGARMATSMVISELADALDIPASYLAWGWRPPSGTQARAIWILDVFGSASNDELKQIKVYNPPNIAHKRLPWLVAKLLLRGRPMLAVNAKKVYDLRSQGERR